MTRTCKLVLEDKDFAQHWCILTIIKQLIFSNRCKTTVTASCLCMAFITTETVIVFFLQTRKTVNTDKTIMDIFVNFN